MGLQKGDLVIVPTTAQKYHGRMAEIVRVIKLKKGGRIAARVVDRTGTPINNGTAIVTWSFPEEN
jgi:hypothetical protein